jgi:ribosomal protein L27
MPNDIIARQRGFKWKTGTNVIVGKDQTIHAEVEGIVQFRDSVYRKTPYKIIDVIAKVLPNRKISHPPPYNYHPELFP